MSKNSRKLIIKYIVCALLLVLLFSPGLIGLNLSSPNILVKGFAIIFAVLIPAYLIWQTVAFIRSDKYVHVEAGKQDSLEQISAVLERYTTTDVVSSIAKSAVREIAAVQRKRSALENVIAGKFERNSMSYDRFMTAVNQAADTIEKNAASLANRLQSFDVVEYRHLATIMQTGSYRRDNIPDEIQHEQASLYQQQYSEMQSIITANEGLLLELDKFSNELAQLDASQLSGDNSAILDELKRLSEEARYYV